MLVLSRKLGEKILIGDSIVLTVVKIDRNQVRLGIQAPSGVSILRQELLDVSPAPEKRAERPIPIRIRRVPAAGH